MLSKDKDVEAEDDPTQPLTQISCGQEGTPVTLTVLRHGRQIQMTMNRMNIEDIKESKYRHQWEEVIRELGFPKQGAFIGPDAHNLRPRNQVDFDPDEP